MRKRVGEAAVDAAIPADDSVPGNNLIGYAEVAAPVGDELVDFFEGAGIEQEVDPLARGQLACFALPAETILSAAQLGAPLLVSKNVLLVHPDGPLDLGRLRLLPVLQEPFEPDVGQRMLEALLNHRRRRGDDVRANASRLDDMDGTANARDEDFGGQLEVVEDVDRSPVSGSSPSYPRRPGARRRD